jgi:transposase
MGRPLSNDLRERVVSAVSGGLSRRRAAAQFDVSVSSAIRWTRLSQRTGEVKPKPQGGDTRSARIEAHAALIFSLLEARRDMTLEELRAGLAERGVAVAVSTLWRFFERHGITLKKRPGMRPSRIAPTS